MEAVGIIKSISPVDRVSARLVEQAVLASKDLVEPQGMPYEVWVGGSRVRRPPEADLPDAATTYQNGEHSGHGAGGSYIQFVIDAENEVTVKIIDRASGEVIRTIPPDELAKYAHESTMTPGRILETLL